MAHMRGSAADSSGGELQSNVVLVQAAQALSADHDTYGTYAGADLQAVQGARLVRADATALCIEAGEGGSLYHLESSVNQDNTWNWGAVKGACPAQ